MLLGFLGIDPNHLGGVNPMKGRHRVLLCIVRWPLPCLAPDLGKIGYGDVGCSEGHALLFVEVSFGREEVTTMTTGGLGILTFRQS